MIKTTILTSCFAVFILLSGCNDSAKKDDASSEMNKTETTKNDMSQVRADIQAIENQWADALNKKDINALIGLYADDATSMQDGGPTLRGKAAIHEQQEKDFARPDRYASISFQTEDVFGSAVEVTEVGTSTEKDAAGKVSTGKYMAVFKKVDGKYLCIREIYNKDSK